MISKKRMKEVALFAGEHGIEAAAEHFRLGVPSVKRYISHYNEITPVKIKDDNSEATVTTDELLTVDEIMEFGDLNPTTWKPHRLDYNRRADGKLQFKASFLHVGLQFDLDEYIRQFEEHVAGIPTPEFKYEHREPTSRLGTISVADWHHGKLVWGKEISGKGDNWDIKTSRREFAKYITYATEILSMHDVDTIVIELLGDFFNVDNTENTTVAGTQQSEDSRYLKTQAYAEEMMVSAIEACRHTANNVVLVIVPGNHDATRILLLGSYLRAYFRNDPGVVIEGSPATRKHFVWGTTLLAYSHELKGDAVQNMYALWPEDCATCTDLIYNTGHYHSRKDMIPVIEYRQSVKLVQHPAMVPEDAWSDSKGFRHVREGLVRVFDAELGQVCEYGYKSHFMEEIE